MESHHPSGERQNPSFRYAAGILGFLIVILMAVPLVVADTQGPDNGPMIITVRDAVTGSALAGAKVYPDGKLAGSTQTDGTILIRNLKKAPRSIRVTNEGYRENTTLISQSADTSMTVILSPSPVIRLLGSGSPDTTLDIVFVASNTSYNCNIRKKVAALQYVGRKETFVSDVRRLSEENLFQLVRFTRTPSNVPEGYPRRITVWYYWDESRYADAFLGCSGTLPDGFFEDAPFADVAIILYPAYTGRYTGDPCEPQGCSNGAGPGLQSRFKVPAGAGMMFMHESGHAIFGLMDTYCGDTYYAENQPFPNIWASEPGCRSDTVKNGLNASLCRPFVNESPAVPVTCGRGFYRYDPAPDLMGSTTDAAKFGDASTLHIRYILDRFPGG